MKRTHQIVFAVLTSLTSCSPAPDLPKIGSLKPFTLTEAGGTSISPGEMRGKVWVVHLFFTSCPTICPKMINTIRDLGESIEGPLFLSISVDPETDTPERLRSFAIDQRLDGTRWKLATTDEATLKRMATESLKIGTAEKLDLHSTRLVLVDDEGQVRGLYSAEDPEAVDRLKRDLKKLL